MLGCNIYSDGSAAAIDTWNPSETKTNVLDSDQVCQMQSILSNLHSYFLCACRRIFVSIMHRLKMGLCDAREFHWSMLIDCYWSTDCNATYRFSRHLKGTSKGQDLNLDSDYYILFGTGDSPQGINTLYLHCIDSVLTLINPFLIESRSGGFTFHEKTPRISASQVNPAQDNSLVLELAMVASAESDMCPQLPVSWVFCLWDMY